MKPMDATPLSTAAAENDAASTTPPPLSPELVAGAVGSLDFFFWLGALAQKVFLGEAAEFIALPDVQLGKFRLLKLLGTGAYGAVFLARDSALDRDVALKIAWPSIMLDPVASSRFVEEPRTVASLNHPGIVRVFESGAIDMLHYISLEYIEGATLADRLAERERLTCREAAFVVEQVARAVGFAHAHGVIHRDLKPSNILLAQRSQAPGVSTPLVTDFGLARHSRPLPQPFTQSYALLGTDHYMSPEQASGQTKQVGEASDIFSLGVILFESITGHRPFDGETSVDIHREIAESAPRAFSQLRLRCPASLQAIVEKCLQKSPGLRYRSADSLADDLSRYLRGEPVAARRATPLVRSISYARRHPARIAFSVLSVCIAALVGALVANQLAANRQIVAARQAARHADIRERELRYASQLQSIGGALGRLNRTQLMGELAQARALTHDFGTSMEYEILAAQLDTAGARSWSAHEGSIYEVKCSPRDDTVASAGEDGYVRLWNRATGARIAEFDDGLVEVNGIEFSPDGRFLAAVGDSGHLVVRSLDGLGVVADCQIMSSKVYDVDWIDHERLVVGGMSDMATIFNLRDGSLLRSKPLPSIPGKDDRRIQSLEYLQSSNEIAIAMTPATGNLLSPTTLEVLRPFPAEGGIWKVAEINTADGILAAVTESSGFQAWQLPELRASRPLPQLGSRTPTGLRALCFDQRREMLFATTEDASICVLPILEAIRGLPVEWQRRVRLADHAEGLDLSRDGNWLVTGDVAGSIRVWSADKLATALDQIVTVKIGHLEFSPCGRWLACALRRDNLPPLVLMLDARSGQRLWDTSRFDAPPAGPVAARYNVSLCFDDRGASVAVIVDDCTVRELDTATGEVRQQYAPVLNPLPAEMQFTPDGKSLHVQMHDGRGLLLDRATGKQVAQLGDAQRFSLGYFRTVLGDNLLETTVAGVTMLVDPTTGLPKFRLPGPTTALNYAAVSSDGKTLAATGDHLVYVWNLERPEDYQVLEIPSVGISQLAISPDGKSLLCRSYENKLHFWNLSTGLLVLEIGSAELQVAHFALSPDGATLVVLAQTGNVDGLQFYRLDVQSTFPNQLDLPSVAPSP